MEINCKKVSDHIRSEIRRVLLLYPDLRPRLNVIMVGHNPASEVYVRNKAKACINVGIEFNLIRLEDTVESPDIMFELRALRNSVVDQQGVMVQLPLPERLRSSTDEILDRIHWSQDVDCLTNYNLGKIWLGQNPTFVPCTALGIMKVIQYMGYGLTGRNAVIIGRSKIVGKPMAALLTNANMTVTQCHSYTDQETLMQAISSADLIICAVGQPKFLNLSNLPLKPNTIIFDVGINRNEEGKLCGDCYWEDEPNPSIHWTPVPGGVGVMTVTGLLMNTLHAALMASRYTSKDIEEMLYPILRVNDFKPL